VEKSLDRGQFFMLHCGGSGKLFLPFSMLNSVDRGCLSVSVAQNHARCIVGAATCRELRNSSQTCMQQYAPAARAGEKGAT